MPATPVPEVPNWADQLEAWSTFAGVIATLLAFAVAATLLSLEMRRSRQAERQLADEQARAAGDRELARQDRGLARAERRDASAAHARLVLSPRSTFTGKRADEQAEQMTVRVKGTISNFGTAPIRRVTVIVRGYDRLDGLVVVVHTSQMILANGQESIAARFPLDVDPGDGPSPSLQMLLEARFMDVNGLRWKRQGDELPKALLG